MSSKAWTLSLFLLCHLQNWLITEADSRLRTVRWLPAASYCLLFIYNRRESSNQGMWILAFRPIGPICYICPSPKQSSDIDCSKPVVLKVRSSDQQLKLLRTRKSVRKANSRSSLSSESEMLGVGVGPASSLNVNKTSMCFTFEGLCFRLNRVQP